MAPDFWCKMMAVNSQNSTLKLIHNHIYQFTMMTCFRAIYEDIDVHHHKGAQSHSNCWGKFNSHTLHSTGFQCSCHCLHLWLTLCKGHLSLTIWWVKCYPSSYVTQIVMINDRFFVTMLAKNYKSWECRNWFMVKKILMLTADQ